MPIRIESGSEIINEIGLHALNAVFLFILTKTVHLVIARRNERKRVFGAPICWWAPGMYFLGALIGLIVEEYEPSRGGFIQTSEMFATVGFWIGVCLGFIHGGRRIDRKFPLARLPESLDDDRLSGS